MPKISSHETKAKWETIVNKQKNSGLSIKQWCRNNQIAHSAFYYWRDKLFLQPSAEPILSKSCFTELSEPQKSEIVLECEGIRICLGRDFDPVALKQCLILLQEVKC